MTLFFLLHPTSNSTQNLFQNTPTIWPPLSTSTAQIMVQSHKHASLRILLTASSIDLPASVLMTRVIVQKLRYDHSKPVLQSLQWLPTQVRAKSTASAQLCYPNLTPFSLLTQSRPLQPPCWASTLQSSPHVRILGHTLPSTSKAFPSWKCMAFSLTFFRTCLNIAFVSRSSRTTVCERATPWPYQRSLIPFP